MTRPLPFTKHDASPWPGTAPPMWADPRGWITITILLLGVLADLSAIAQLVTGT